MSEERFKLSSHLPYIYHVEVQVNATALGVSECKPVTRYGVEEKDRERERRQSEAGGGGEGGGVTFAGGQPSQGGVGVNMGDGVLVRRHPVAVLGARDLSCRGPRPGYSGNNV